jgi:hypothetical protein
MDTAAEFQKYKYAANCNNTAKVVEGSGQQSSLEPHGRTMAFVPNWRKKTSNH